MRVLSWNAEAVTRYVRRARAVLPLPTSRTFPVPGSGTSASSGTGTSDSAAIDATTRFGTQLALPGDGNSAGSPIADQMSRPVGSPNPPIGFQAAVGRAATPRRSQAFHGKSLSLAGRMKTAELNPSR